MKNYVTNVLSCLMIATMAMTSCNNKSSNNNQSTSPSETTDKILQVDDILSDADNYISKTVKVEGVCTHTCKHGGKKMFLMGSDDTKTIRVDASKEIGSFPSKVVNNIVVVTGTLVEERIDESVIRKMEEQYKSKQMKKHGDDAEVGCVTEKNAHGQKDINGTEQRIKNYRKRIAERQEKEGKEYLSFYAIKGESYEIR